MSKKNTPSTANADTISPESVDPSADETNENGVGKNDESVSRAREIGGPKGPEPTRYGDWEQNGRCTDF
ncbi:MAG: DUF1674 domain-containing protein [Lysobacterales bacterium]